MKRSTLSLLSMTLLVLFATPLWALDPIFTPDLPIDPTLPTFNKLTVNVQGSGRVKTNPGNLVCETNSTGSSTTCEGFFFPGTPVALDATPIDGETFTSSFGQWSDDCNGTLGACAVVMDTAKEVTAQFFALGIPLVTLETPNATETFGYHAVFEPETKTIPEKIKPVAVGEYQDGISVKVGLPSHFNPVDVYLGISLPNSDEIFMVDSSNSFVPLSSGLTPWKSSITSEIDETVFSNVPTGLLPDGEYDIHFMVTPAGDLTKYYHWRSSFDVYPNVNPLVP